MQTLTTDRPKSICEYLVDLMTKKYFGLFVLCLFRRFSSVKMISLLSVRLVFVFVFSSRRVFEMTQMFIL